VPQKTDERFQMGKTPDEAKSWAAMSSHPMGRGSVQLAGVSDNFTTCKIW